MGLDVFHVSDCCTYGGSQEGDRVKVSESPCENHICVNTGWISRPNEIIVCLPNEVVVRLERRNSR
ncbi:MAG: NusG domain II-containing protein [Candidatus Fermentithermobacillus carboniphilus]|uniref:NusG domain II-containing protein n=1 Tax=Candidatus Fermentithermobacillus carboniphilus TaxID=3085328 RepID=A0AAT9LGP1_9FIRM|nr:MAG: NusG domain II-containing protein [Candidatus Fermentithermobacillus carboniphilus]